MGDEPASSAAALRTSTRAGDGTKLKTLFDRAFPLKYSVGFYKGIEAGTYGNCAVRTYLVDGDASALSAAACVSLQVGEHSLARRGVLAAPKERDEEEEKSDEALGAAGKEKEALCSAYVLTLATDEAQQRRGLGTRVVRALLEDLERAPGCVAVYLHVLTNNLRAIALYEKCGFVRLGRIPEFYDIDATKHDAFVYVKALKGADVTSFEEASDVVLKGWFVATGGSGRNLAEHGDGDDVSPNEDLLDAVADAISSTWSSITQAFSELWKGLRTNPLEPDEEELDPNEQEHIF